MVVQAVTANQDGYNKDMLRVQSKLLLLTLLTGQLFWTGAQAVPVPDLYTAQVPTAGLSGAPLDAAFALALDEVLVRVTGQRLLSAASARRQALGPAGPLVRRYQSVPGGKVRVSFDPEALHRRLDAANLPVWADDRPRTLVILPADVATSVALPDPVSVPGVAPPGDPAGSSQQLLLATAASRGVPVVLATERAASNPTAENPLLDAESTARAAGADLLLVGRRAAVGGPAVLRWTLAQGSERAEWQGDVADGVHGLADRLAARYASAAAGARVLRLRVDGIDSFDAYGRVQSYLRSVGLVQSAELQRVAGSTLFFELTVRGGVEQLDDAFALQHVLAPMAASASGDLIYRLVPGNVDSP